jgi:uncharacterized membrane protein YgdD (TMEM256/DUF423 family)
LAGVAVTAGAIGTHFLKETLELPQDKLDTYEVAVRYQMYHALALVLVGILAARAGNRWLTASGSLLVAGIVLFSGGIYAWLLTDIKPFVHVVPIGGMAWIVAWILLAIGAARMPASRGREA